MHWSISFSIPLAIMHFVGFIVIEQIITILFCKLELNFQNGNQNDDHFPGVWEHQKTIQVCTNGSYVYVPQLIIIRMKAFLFQHVPFKPALKTTHQRSYAVHQHQPITSLLCCFLSVFSVVICISDLWEIARSIPFMWDFYFFLSFRLQ